MFINAFPIPPEEMIRSQAIKAREKALIQELQNRKLYLGAYLSENLAETTQIYFDVATWKEVPPAQQNLIYRMIKRISLVYKNQPEYLYSNDKEFDPKKQPELPEGYDELARWVFMKESERKTNLLGTSLLHPVVRDGKMDWDYIWGYFPFFDAANPKKLTAVMYSLTQSDVDISRDNEITWVFWSEEKHFLFKNGAFLDMPENPNHENPFGILPFAEVSTKEKDSGLGLGYGGQLWEANVSVNNIFTEMALGTRLNLMGQWVYNGPGDVKEIQLGVNKIAGIPAGSTLEMITPEADIEAAIMAIRARYEGAAQDMGLIIKWAESGEAKSGVALRIESVELLESREDDVPKWHLGDNKLYEIEQIIASKTPDFGDLPKNRSVNFSEIEFPVTPEEQTARDKADIEMGLTSPAKVLMKRNPDGFTDLAAAQKEVDENKPRRGLRERFNGQQRTEQIDV